MKRLLLWAMPGLIAGATLGWAFSPSGAMALRDPAARALIRAVEPWDELNRRLDPHEPFLRPAERVDPRPLSAQATRMWEDLALQFTVFDGALLLLSTPPVEIGDHCLWQGVYAATTALAGDKRRAGQALQGLKLLASRGRPLARSVLPRWIVTEKPGRWFYRDEAFQWKEDASVDGAAGWIFGILAVIELVPERRAEALAALQRFTDAVIDNGYVLRNSDGSPTRYGTMGGRVVNSPVGLLVSLAALKTLHRYGAGERYGRAYERLAKRDHLRWAAYGSAQRLGDNSTTNHNIAHLALAAALLAENDAARWRVYARGLLRLQELTANMGNSFWIYLAEWTLSRRPELTATLDGEPVYRRYLAARPSRLEWAKKSLLEWDYPYCKRRGGPLREPPPGMRTVRWPFSPRALAAQPIPVHRRPVTDFVWQRSPYLVDQWSWTERPSNQYMPLDFLAAYALGRAVGALGESD